MSRTEEISNIFRRWLERFTPPQGIKSNPRAMQDEAESLFRILLRSAPREAYSDWVANVLSIAETAMKTRAWPTAHELGSACTGAMKHRQSSSEHTVFDPMIINANRIHAGDPVGDDCLYGRNAIDLVSRGLVSEADLDRYRSGMFFSARRTYGEAEALRIEGEMKHRHEMARNWA